MSPLNPNQLGFRCTVKAKREGQGFKRPREAENEDRSPSILPMLNLLHSQMLRYRGMWKVDLYMVDGN